MLTERRKKIQISLSGEVRPQQQHEQRPVIAELFAQQANRLPDTVIDRLRGDVEAGGYFFVGHTFQAVHTEGLPEFRRHFAQSFGQPLHQFTLEVEIGVVERLFVAFGQLADDAVLERVARGAV